MEMSNVSSSSDPWALDYIGATEAWDISTGSKRVSVAIIDTGVDALHPDLDDNFDLYSYSSSFDTLYSVNSDIDAYPGGHGTQVAGIIGAEGDNNADVSGVCQNVDLVSLSYYVPSTPLYLATSYAVNHSIQKSIPIINFSSNFNYSDSTFEQSIRSYSGLFVCAAGNESLDIDLNNSNKRYPSSYENIDNLISVGSINSSGQISSFSNYGADSVDLFAPGENIYTTDLSPSGYGDFSLTSSAAPLVAGTAALLKSTNPVLSACQIKDAIMDNVTHSTNLIGKCVSGGRLNTYAAALSVIPTLSGSSDRNIDDDSYNWEKFNVASPSTHSFSLNGISGLTMTLTSNPTSNATILETSTIQTGQTSTSFSHLFPSSGTYYIKVSNPSTNYTSYTLSKSFVSFHYHSFTGPKVYIDNDYHGVPCECGEYGNIMPHICKPQNPHLCIQCGGSIL